MRTTLLLTAGAFAAGFFTLRYWPQEPPQNTAPAAMSSVSPAAEPLRAGSPPPPSWLARRLTAQQRAAALTPAAARAIMERLRPPVPPEDEQWIAEVIRCWAAAEPEAAVDWLRQWSRHGGISYWAYAALESLARKDLRAALHASTFLSSGDTTALLAAAAETDPAATMAFLEKNRQIAFQGARAYRVWLQRDPAAACAWLAGSRFRDDFALRDMAADIAALAPDRLAGVLASLPDGSAAKNSALESLAAFEVDRDPAAALAKFSSLSEAERARMQGPLTRHLAAHGKPGQIMAFMGALAGEPRQTFLSELSDEIGYGTAERMLSIIRRSELSESERAQLLRKATTLGPEHAEEFMAGLNYRSFGDARTAVNYWESNLSAHLAETLPVLRRMVNDGTVDRDLLVQLTAGLACHDPARAEQLLAALPEAHRAGPSAMLALRAAFHTDGADLSAYTGLPDAAARQAVLKQFFQASEGDFDSSRRAAFVRQLPPAQQVETLGGMTFTGSDAALFQPLVAAAAQTAPQSEDLTRAVRSVAASQQDSAAAMQWLATLPPGAACDAGRASVFYKFTRQDAAAASAWLDAQPRDLPRRDDMVKQLTGHIQATDPERAWQWAATIGDESIRRSVQQGVLHHWQTADPAAAARAAAAVRPQ